MSVPRPRSVAARLQRTVAVTSLLALFPIAGSACEAEESLDDADGGTTTHASEDTTPGAATGSDSSSDSSSTSQSNQPDAGTVAILAGDACPPADLGRGVPVRLPTPCADLAAQANECGIEFDTASCALDEDCARRECFIYCLRGVTPCEELELFIEGEETRLGTCLESCGDRVFCGGGYLEHERYCDGVDDCPGRGDERQTPQTDGSMQCAGSNYRHAFCNDVGFGFAAPLEICDGSRDCIHGEDEAEENCVLGIGYHCQNSEQRVPRRAVCDRVVDCPEGDDEPCSAPIEACPALDPVVEAYIGPGSICSIARLGPRESSGLSVSVNEGFCEDGEPYFPRDVCNGTLDCPDGIDEAGCPIVCEDEQCEFPCADGDTVPLDALCDGVADCSGGDDEPCVDRFWCTPTVAVELERMCDGTEDCDEGQDELYCPPPFFTCHDGEQIVFPVVSVNRPNSLCTLPQCDDESDVVCINPP